VDPHQATPGTVQLFIVFLGSMTMGTVFALLLRPHGQILKFRPPLI
jgi:hypothetical protein